MSLSSASSYDTVLALLVESLPPIRVETEVDWSPASQLL